MRFNLYLKPLALTLVLSVLAGSSWAQLFFEGLVFDGMGKPLLENVTSVAISPDGQYIYTSSFDDNAISIYSRDNVSSAPGDLTFLGIQKNEVENVVGLTGAFDLEVSPDGRHVYAAGSSDNAVVVFARNADDGMLTYTTTYWDGIGGVTGLTGAYFIDLSPDGNHVYVTGPDANAIAVFERNVMSGELMFVESFEDESGGIDEMSYPLSLKVSPDGKNVYVCSFGDNALNVFTRNPATGKLSFIENYKDGVGGVMGLDGAYTPFVSPDGANVYVAASDSSSIVVFSRDAVSGELEYIETLYDGEASVSGISGVSNITISPNGNYVYAAGSNSNTIAIFSRAENTGSLSFLCTREEGVDGIYGLFYPLGLEMSQDGKSLYVAGFGSAAVPVFDVDENGMLTFKTAETEGTTGVSGIDGANALAVSPDFNFIYACGYFDVAIVVFSRNEISGGLTFVQKITDGSATDGLNGINSIAMSPDGNYVYTTGFWDKSIIVFARNTSSGELTYIERYKDGVSGVDGLNGVNSIVISDDGKSAYSTGFWEHAVAVFERNLTTGKLTFLEVFKDGSGGVDGLNRASFVDVSPDGSSVYVAGYNDNAISMFTRNSDGTLAYEGIMKDGVGGVDGLNKVNCVVVSPNGKNLYSTGYNDDAMSIFERDTDDGMLSYVGQMKNGVGDVVNFDGPSRLVMSMDGEHIYATSGNDDAIIAFRRDLTDGTLFFETALQDGVDNVNGLNGAQTVAVTPDGKHMYAAATVDDAVSFYSCTYLLDMTEIVCEGDSVVVGASVYRENGVYIDTFNFGACKSVITLDLTVHPEETIVNKEICNGDVVEFNGSTYSTTGNYEAMMTSSIGCDSLVKLNLTVVNTFSTFYESAEICSGESYTLGTEVYTTSGNYTQSFTSDFGCDSTVVLDLVVKQSYDETVNAEICDGDFYIFGSQNYITAGEYTETFTSKDGCDSTVTLNLSILAPFMTVTETICQGDAYEIGTETFTESGTYTVTVEGGSGCQSEVTLNLTVNAATHEVTDAEICAGQSYSFEGETYTESGTYINTITQPNGCDNTSTLNLTVHVTDVAINEVICAGESYTLGTTTYSTSGVYQESFTGSALCGDSVVTLTLTVEPGTADVMGHICEGESYELGSESYTETGIYTQTVTSNAGCESVITLDLTVSDLVEADLTETLCAGESFSVGTNVYTESGTYSDVLSSAAGCDSTVTLNLTVLSAVQTSGTVTSDDEGGDTGAIDISVSGGMPPYNYAWSNGATTEDLTNIPGGVYTIVVTDANGCTTEINFTVDSLDPIVDPALSFGLEIYPNPVKGGNSTNLSITSTKNQAFSLRLFDGVGKLIRTEAIELGIGDYIHPFEMPAVSGVYLLQVSNGEGGSKTFTLTVQ